MSDTIITEMAEWAAALEYEQVPERVREKARLQLFSVLGAIHASSRHEIGKAITAAVGSWAGDGPCTIIPSGRRADLLSAVYANAALSIALDYDDYLLFGHTGHSAVCVSLAMAEREKRSMKAALAAQVIANEIEGRMGAGVVMGPHNGQAWSHIHLAGSAAAASKLMGLSAEQTAHAMAIALYQPTYVLYPGFMGPDSKATTAATPSVTGVQAAILASKGATGPLDVIEHPQGFLARFSYVPSPFFISGFGRAWTTDTLAYKIYPGCAYIDTTVDAVLKLRERYREENGRDLDPEDVSDVLVEATILTIEMDNLSKTGGAFDPLNPVSINFSIPGNVAIALGKGRLTADDLSKKALQENADMITAISGKVRLKHDWALTLRFLEAMDQTIKLREVASEFKLTRLAGMRRRMQDQYQSSMGISLNDLKILWTEHPEVRARLWKGIKDRIGAAFTPATRREKDGYDLGRCPLDRFTMPFAARVTITLRGGLSTTCQQDIPWGGPGHPLDRTREFVLDKYSREAGTNLEDNKIKSLVQSVEGLETKLTLKKLMEYCCAGD
ncbi:MAG TPA: MmgE/PrpD family protein [bacterium]|nr:MmgE/PrpD family protein [bacterium]